MTNQKPPIAYKAKREFHTEDHSIDLDKGDEITVEEYDSLSEFEQAAFEPIFSETE